MKKALAVLVFLVGVAIFMFATLPATDSFTGTNGSALSANWTANHGTFNIQNNSACSASGGSTELAHWNADVFGNDQYAQGNISLSGTSGDKVGLAVRVAASAETGYVFQCQGPQGSANGCTLFRGVAGSYTQLGSTWTSPTSGDLMQITVTGSGTSTVITVNDAGTTMITFTDTSGSAINSGSAGLSGFNSDTGDCIDNFQADNVTAVTPTMPPAVY